MLKSCSLLQFCLWWVFLIVCFWTEFCHSKSGPGLPGSLPSAMSVLGHHLPSCSLHHMLRNPVTLMMGPPWFFVIHSTVSRNFPDSLGHLLLLICAYKPEFFFWPAISIPPFPPTSRIKTRDERWRRQLPPVLFSCCYYTQYHKLGGLIQHKCIISKLWRSQVWNQFH